MATDPSEPVEPRGIAGWLIPPAIGMVVNPLMVLGGLVSNINIVSAPPDPISPEVQSLARWGLLVGMTLLPFQVVVAVKFFRKSRSAPRLMICLLVVNLGLTIVSTTLAALTYGWYDAEDQEQILGALTVAAVWIPYFLKSKRVRHTFTVEDPHPAGNRSSEP